MLLLLLLLWWWWESSDVGCYSRPSCSRRGEATEERSISEEAARTLDSGAWGLRLSALAILIRMLKDDDDDGMDLSYYAIEARGGGGEEEEEEEEEEEAGEAGEAPVSTGKDAGEQGRAVAEDGEGNGYTARLVTAAYLFVLSDLNHLLVRHVVFTAGSGSWRRSEMG